jgi:hypothetical protein
LLLDQPFRRVQVDAGAVVLFELVDVGAVVAPVTQRAGADEDRVAGAQLRLLLLEGADQVLGRNAIVDGQRVDLAEAGDVDEDAARDDGRNGGDVAFADAEVPAPVLFLEAVVPVVVVADGDVGEAVDLRGDVVRDEQGAAMPADLVRVELQVGRALKSFCRLTPSGPR